MRPNKSFILRISFLATALVLLFLGLLCFQPKEPIYNGKPLSHWLSQLQYESSQWPTPLQPEAKVAVAHIGTNAIPFLLRSLREKPPTLIGLRMLIYEKLNILEPLYINSAAVVGAFDALGSAARPAIPELAYFVTNKNAQPSGPISTSGVTLIAYNSLLALGGIGPDALPALTTILTNSTSVDLRLYAIEAIMKMGTNAQPALSALIHTVDAPNDLVASQAVKALGIVGPREQAVFDTLDRVLHGQRKQVKGEALVALGSFGPKAVPALVRALSETDNDGTAFFMLRTAAPDALTNHTVLAIGAEGLKSADRDRRTWAADLLQAAGRQAGLIHSRIPLSPAKATEILFNDATNTLRHLAPDLLDSSLNKLAL